MFRTKSFLFLLFLTFNIISIYGCPEHEHSSTPKPEPKSTTKPEEPQHEVEGKSDTTNSVSSDLKVICYYGSWAVYRPGNGKFPVEEIDPFLCTHLIYAFAGLSQDNKIRPLDPYNDLKENYGKGAFLRFNALKNQNKDLKTLIAIGGWNEGSVKYSNMAANPESRKVFVESVVKFIERFGFDGLDLDWEYPASRGGKPEDKKNLVSLLRELKEAFAPRGYLLTSAVSAGKWNIDPAYDIPAISQYLDIINVMCYDYHGGWEDRTGHNAPLYARPDEVDNNKISNVNFSINYWISKGAPKNKIVLGMGTYGRSFTLQRSENNGFNAPAPQKGQAGPYTREAGSLGYNEICEMRQNNDQWTEVKDPYYLAPYAFRDRQWVGYDDVESITLKAQYAKAMQLGGAMIWSVETDDFRGKCGPKYPLLNAINQVFKSNAPVVMPLPNPSASDSSTAAPVTKPWVVIQSSTTPKSSTPSTTMTWWPRPSSSVSPSASPSASSVQWWSSTPSSSSSSTSWPWAPTHPPHHHSSSPTKPEEMTSPTTSSTTTPKPVTPGHEVEETPGQESSKPFVCTQMGIFKHQTDCQKFYRCVQTQVDGVYKPFEYSCPAKTVFNPSTNLCDWVENVPHCAKKVPNNFFRFHNAHGK